MLGFRMNRGVSERRFFDLHGVSMDSCWGEKLNRLERDGFLCHEGGVWKLSRKGMDLQNTVLVELMDG